MKDIALILLGLTSGHLIAKAVIDPTLTNIIVSIAIVVGSMLIIHAYHKKIRFIAKELKEIKQELNKARKN